MPFGSHDNEECTESTLLYHLMSGLHTSINTHVSANFFGANGDRFKNDTYFMERIGNHPVRVKNLHLLYSAAIRAVGLISRAMERQDYSTGIDEAEDAKTPLLVEELLKEIKLHRRTFSEQHLFRSITGRKQPPVDPDHFNDSNDLIRQI